MKLIYRGKVWELEGKMTVRDAIQKVGLNPESVLATRQGKVINEEELLDEDDEIRLVSVISGGRG